MALHRCGAAAHTTTVPRKLLGLLVDLRPRIAELNGAVTDQLFGRRVEVDIEVADALELEVGVGSDAFHAGLDFGVALDD